MREPDSILMPPMEPSESRLMRGFAYPLGDRLNLAECQAYGLPQGGGGVYIQTNIKAVWNGEPSRPVRKGEWYFSGAIIAAYRAPADLDGPYHVGRLVKVKRVETFEITELPEITEE